jgi:hypothetical protein
VLPTPLASTGLLWGVPVILNVGVSLSDRSPGGGQEPPMHVGRARRMGQVRPDLGGAAGPTSS